MMTDLNPLLSHSDEIFTVKIVTDLFELRALLCTQRSPPEPSLGRSSWNTAADKLGLFGFFLLWYCEKTS